MNRSEAKALYCQGKKIYQFINGDGYKKYTPSSYYSSGAPAGELFERQFGENESRYGKAAHDNFTDEDGFVRWLALCHAEKIGVMEYEVDTRKKLMTYISFYGNEGFYKVIHNLITHEETRTPQKSTRKPYNYFVG